jgi:hypothetical protein
MLKRDRSDVLNDHNLYRGKFFLIFRIVWWLTQETFVELVLLCLMLYSFIYLNEWSSHYIHCLLWLQKSFRFPYVPSPPDSLHSDGSSYSSPGPSSGGTTASNSANNPNGSVNSRRPITPCLSGGGIPGGIITPSPGAGSSAPATITSATQQQRSPPPPLHPPLLGILPHVSTARHTHPHHNHHPHHHHPTGSSNSSSLGIGNNQNSSGASSSSTSTSILVSSSNASSTSTSHTQVHDQHEEAEDSSPDTENHHPITSMHQSGSGGPGNSRAQYLSANCVVYENYRGDTDRIVEEHFTRALSASYANEKGSKCKSHHLWNSKLFEKSFEEGSAWERMRKEEEESSFVEAFQCPSM